MTTADIPWICAECGRRRDPEPDQTCPRCGGIMLPVDVEPEREEDEDG